MLHIMYKNTRNLNHIHKVVVSAVDLKFRKERLNLSRQQSDPLSAGGEACGWALPLDAAAIYQPSVLQGAGLVLGEPISRNSEHNTTTQTKTNRRRYTTRPHEFGMLSNHHYSHY